MSSDKLKGSKPGTENQELLGLLRELDGGEGTVMYRRLAAGGAAVNVQWPPVLRERNRSAINLEKHLIGIHREELASLLKDACARLVMSSDKVNGIVLLNRTDGVAVEPPSEGDWKQRCTQMRATLPDPVGSEAEMLVLDRLVAPAVGGAPNLREVAEAGLSLAPSTALQIYRAYGLEADGDFRGAACVLEKAHQESWKYMNQLESAAVLGRVALADGDPLGALRWYERAATGREPYSHGAIGWVFSSIQAGQADALRCAAGELLNHLGTDMSIFDDYVIRLRADLLSGGWEPTQGAIQLSKMSWSDDHVQRIFKLFR